jgi:hypothetical protein
LPQALTLLAALKGNLTKSLHPDLVRTPPQLMQVWFEPPSQQSVAGARAAASILTLEGKLQLTPQTLMWTLGLDAAAVRVALGAGGRVLVRIHCGNLWDAQKRVFTSSLDQILGTTSLRIPGGVLESWFFVAPG